MPPTDADADWRALNRANWDERVPVHLGPGGYDLSSQRAGRGRLDAIVDAELGPVAGLRVLHLQCHIGDDSIALAQRGAAEVVGVDFSAPAVEAARALAAECGAANARFVLSDVLEAPAALPAEAGAFDLVFTTWGTVTWYSDIARWGQVVGHFLRPGGALYFADMHPAAAVFDGLADPADGEARPGWLMPYLGRVPQIYDDAVDYADPSTRLVNSRTVVWLHPLADILGALRDGGLALDWLREHPRLTWRLFPGLVQDTDRLWTWPGRPWLPLAVSLRATRC
jgi:SAM-dependent methyltransferase